MLQYQHMISLIHGDNELQVRQEIKNLKDKYRNREIVTLVKPDAMALRQQLMSTNLFFDDKVTIVERMFEKGVGEDVVNFLATVPAEQVLFFAETKRMDKAEKSSKTTLKGKALLELLKKKIPAIQIIAANDYTVFDFLDALTPGNATKALVLYDKLLANKYASEELFALMIDQFRTLIILSDLGPNAVPGMHQFRKQKLARQASRYQLKTLTTIYQRMFQLEVAQKERRLGEGSPFSMEEDLRFFLATAFS